MIRIGRHITHYLFPALLVFAMALGTTAQADSLIRVIGDKTAPPDVPTTKVTTEAVAPTAKGIITIRIIGDKPGPLPPPAPPQAAPNDASQPPLPIVEIRVIGDKPANNRQHAPTPPAATGVAGQQPPVTDAAERLRAEEAERHLAEQLAAKKAAEERRAMEQAELARQSKIREEQASEAARQMAIRQEQEQLAARLAEEARQAAKKAAEEQRAREKLAQEKAAVEAARLAALLQEQERLATLKAEAARQAEKAEQERLAALKADEERLAAANKALLEKSAADAGMSGSPSQPQEGADAGIAGSQPATIWELYLSAKAIDPVLGRTEARVLASRAEADQLTSVLLPHIDSSAGIKRITQTLANYTANDLNEDYTALNYNISARMNLLHLPTLHSLSAAAAGLRGEQAGVVAARQNLILKLTDAYFALLKAQTDKQIARGEINRLKQVLDQTQAFLKAGTGDIIAVYEAQSRLDSAGADLTKSESALRLAEQKLATVVGKPVTAIVNYLPQYPTGPDPDDLDWWVVTMEKEQPRVRQAREGMAQTAAQLKAARAEYLPVVQASGGYDVNRGAAALPTAEVRQWFVGASISLPLYSGGETAAKVRRASASEDERRHLFNETLDQHRENVKQTFFNLRYNISLIRALEQKRTSAEIQLAAVTKGRKIGTRNAIDLLNAEQAYSVALRDYTYALYDNFIRVIQLKAAAGILSETDLNELPPAAPLLSSGLRMPSTSVAR
jgi:outer membrane protein